VLKAIVEEFDLTHAAFVGIRVPAQIGHQEPFSYLTYPDEWQNRYLSQGYLRVDPAIHLALNSILPVDWASIHDERPMVSRLFDEASDFGISKTGLTIPIRGFNGETALFTVTGDFTPGEWRDFKKEHLGDLQLLSYYIYQMIARAGRLESGAPRLSPREVECLKWSSAGKTYDDIASILSISRRAVKLYLDTARHKLNCLSITHAVARAISLKIIPPVF